MASYDVDPYDFDDFDFGDIEKNEVPDDRSPIMAFAIDSTASTKDNLTLDPTGDILELATDSIPEVMDVVEDLSRMKDLGNTLLTDLKEPAKRLGRTAFESVKNYIPGGRIRNAIIDMLTDTRTRTTPSMSDDENQKEAIRGKIDGILGIEGLEAQKQTGNILKATAKNHGVLLSSISSELFTLRSFALNQTLAYQKKSLELKYRQLYVLREQTKFQGEIFTAMHDSLKGILKNTGLPDIVKSDITEIMTREIGSNMLKEGMSNFNKQDSWQGSASNRMTNMASRLKDKIISGTDALQESVDMKASLMEAGLTKADMAGMSIAGVIKAKGKSILGKKLREGMDNTEAGQKLLRDARLLKLNPERFFADKAAENGGSETIRGKGYNLLSSFLTADNIKSDATIQEKALTDAALYNVKTDKTIVDVIPGLLSKQLKVLKEIANPTGTSGSELSYDYSSGRFLSAEKIQEGISDKFRQDSETLGLVDSFRTIKSTINEKDTSGKFSDKDRKVFMDTAMVWVAQGGSPDIRDMDVEDFYNLAKGDSEKLKEYLQDLIKTISIDDLITISEKFLDYKNRIKLTDDFLTGYNKEKLLDRKIIDFDNKTGKTSINKENVSREFTKSIDEIIKEEERAEAEANGSVVEETKNDDVEEEPVARRRPRTTVTDNYMNGRDMVAVPGSSVDYDRDGFSATRDVLSEPPEGGVDGILERRFARNRKNLIIAEEQAGVNGLLSNRLKEINDAYGLRNAKAYRENMLKHEPEFDPTFVPNNIEQIFRDPSDLVDWERAALYKEWLLGQGKVAFHGIRKSFRNFKWKYVKRILADTTRRSWKTLFLFKHNRTGPDGIGQRYKNRMNDLTSGMYADSTSNFLKNLYKGSWKSLFSWKNASKLREWIMAEEYNSEVFNAESAPTVKKRRKTVSQILGDDPSRLLNPAYFDDLKEAILRPGKGIIAWARRLYRGWKWKKIVKILSKPVISDSTEMLDREFNNRRDIMIDDGYQNIADIIGRRQDLLDPRKIEEYKYLVLHGLTRREQEEREAEPEIVLSDYVKNSLDLLDPNVIRVLRDYLAKRTARSPEDTADVDTILRLLSSTGPDDSGREFSRAYDRLVDYETSMGIEGKYTSIIRSESDLSDASKIRQLLGFENGTDSYDSIDDLRLLIENKYDYLNPRTIRKFREYARSTGNDGTLEAINLALDAPVDEFINGNDSGRSLSRLLRSIGVVDLVAKLTAVAERLTSSSGSGEEEEIFGDHDGNGLRDNSWRERLKRKKEQPIVINHCCEEEKEKKKSWWEKILGLVTGLGGLLKSGFDLLTGGIGKLIAGIAAGAYALKKILDVLSGLDFLRNLRRPNGSTPDRNRRRGTRRSNLIEGLDCEALAFFDRCQRSKILGELEDKEIERRRKLLELNPDNCCNCCDDKIEIDLDKKKNIDLDKKPDFKSSPDLTKKLDSTKLLDKKNRENIELEGRRHKSILEGINIQGRWNTSILNSIGTLGKAGVAIAALTTSYGAAKIFLAEENEDLSFKTKSLKALSAFTKHIPGFGEDLSKAIDSNTVLMEKQEKAEARVEEVKAENRKVMAAKDLELKQKAEAKYNEAVKKIDETLDHKEKTKLINELNSNEGLFTMIGKDKKLKQLSSEDIDKANTGAEHIKALYSTLLDGINKEKDPVKKNILIDNLHNIPQLVALIGIANLPKKVEVDTADADKKETPKLRDAGRKSTKPKPDTKTEDAKASYADYLERIEKEKDPVKKNKIIDELSKIPEIVAIIGVANLPKKIPVEEKENTPANKTVTEASGTKLSDEVVKRAKSTYSMILELINSEKNLSIKNELIDTLHNMPEIVSVIGLSNLPKKVKDSVENVKNKVVEYSEGEIKNIKESYANFVKWIAEETDPAKRNDIIDELSRIPKLVSVIGTENFPKKIPILHDLDEKVKEYGDKLEKVTDPAKFRETIEKFYKKNYTGFENAEQLKRLISMDEYTMLTFIPEKVKTPEIINRIKELESELAGKAKETANTATDKVKDFVKMDELKALLEEAKENGNEMVSEKKERLKELWEEANKSGSGISADVKENLKAKYATVIGSLGVAVLANKEKLSEKNNELTSSGKDKIEELQTLLEEAKKDGSKMASDKKERLKELWNEVYSSGSSISDDMKESLRTKYTGFMKDIDNSITTGKEKASEVYKDVTESGTAKINELKVLLEEAEASGSKMASDKKKRLKELWAEVYGSGTIMSENIKTNLLGKYANVMKGLDDATTKAKDSLSATHDEVKTKGSAEVEELKVLLEEAKRDGSKMAEEKKERLKELWAKVNSSGTGMIESAKEKLYTKYEDVTTNIDYTINKNKEEISEAYDKSVEKAKDVAMEVLDKSKSTFTGFVDTMEKASEKTNKMYKDTLSKIMTANPTGNIVADLGIASSIFDTPEDGEKKAVATSEPIKTEPTTTATPTVATTTTTPAVKKEETATAPVAAAAVVDTAVDKKELTVAEASKASKSGKALFQVIGDIDEKKELTMEESMAQTKRIFPWLHEQVGKKYVMGAPTGLNKPAHDCSGLAKSFYSQYGVNLPRVSYMQFKTLPRISKIEDLRIGDIVFFKTDNKRPHEVTHVGMYVGNGYMIHAKGAKWGVVCQRAFGIKANYEKTFRGGGRVYLDDATINKFKESLAKAGVSTADKPGETGEVKDDNKGAPFTSVKSNRDKSFLGKMQDIIKATIAYMQGDKEAFNNLYASYGKTKDGKDMSQEEIEAGNAPSSSTGSTTTGGSSPVETGGGIGASGTTNQIPEKLKPLFAQISKGEGTTHFGYNTIIGDVGSKKSKWRQDSFGNISELPISKIYEYQDAVVKAGAPSTAFGKWQFLKKVLKEEVGLAPDVDETTIFSPEVQDKLMMRRLTRLRKMDKWLAGGIDDDSFQKNLANEFASVALPGTNSSKHGQHVGTKDADIKAAFKAVKSGTGSLSVPATTTTTSPVTTTTTTPPATTTTVSTTTPASLTEKVNADINKTPTVTAETVPKTISDVTTKTEENATKIETPSTIAVASAPVNPSANIIPSSIKAEVDMGSTNKLLQLGNQESGKIVNKLDELIVALGKMAIVKGGGDSKPSNDTTNRRNTVTKEHEPSVSLDV